MRSTVFSRACVALLLASATLAPALASAQVDLAPFLRRAEFNEVRLSPTGEFLALTVPLEDRTVLVVMRRDDRKIVARFGLGPDTHIIRFDWVNPTRLLLGFAQRFGSLDQPQATGELYAIDADGSAPKMLVGQRVGPEGHATRIGTERIEEVAASLVDDLPGDDRNVLVAIQPFLRDAFTRVDRMDVYSGRRTTVAKVPVAQADFHTDHHGVVRLAEGRGADNLSKLYYRASQDAEWQLINDEAKTRRYESPIGFSADDGTAYLRASQAQGPDAVVALDVATLSRRDALRDPLSDPARVIPGLAAPHAPVGIGYDGDTARNAFFDADGADAALIGGAAEAFPGQRVSVESVTQDGTLAVLLVDDATNPGDYFLFDVGKKSASYLLSRRRWMDPAKAAPTRAVTVKARDGLELHGFLTTPRGAEPKSLPLVVMPHGGPFGIADEAAFDDQSEILARAGYAVLRVNYRGSGGRGRSFREAGARQWGRAMQDDVTDATRWAIAQGIADPARVCIYGASYGAYAAMMGAAREPALYKCAAGYVGVYDLPLMHGSVGGFGGSGLTWANDWLGTKDTLDAVSPIHLADRIKVPVFLAAGGADERAPPEHTRRMASALQKSGVPVELMIAPTEGHGFYTDANRRAFQTKLLAFLSRNLGGQVAQ
jgi:dipeptidyl aminopeptidase/acylaminoacyl peptidase